MLRLALAFVVTITAFGCATPATPIHTTTPAHSARPASLPATEESVVLPAPPTDVTALARAEYQKAEQDFATGHYGDAERELDRAWLMQKSPAIKYDLALVHIMQAEALKDDARRAKLLNASWDLYIYFGYAPAAMQDPANESAKSLLRKTAKMLGNGGRSGRQYAAAAIAKMLAGDYNVLFAFDKALEDTEDAALFYWMALGEFRMIRGQPGTKRHDRVLSVEGLDRLQHMLCTYFNGAGDLADVHEARRLYEEISDEIDRSKKLTVRR